MKKIQIFLILIFRSIHSQELIFYNVAQKMVKEQRQKKIMETWRKNSKKISIDLIFLVCASAAPNVVQELYRHTQRRVAHTRILSLSKAVLRNHGCLPADEELPGSPYAPFRCGRTYLLACLSKS